MSTLQQRPKRLRRTPSAPLTSEELSDYLVAIENSKVDRVRVGDLDNVPIGPVYYPKVEEVSLWGGFC